MKDDICKGCGISKSITTHCYFGIVDEREKCPCVNCLVKVICSTQPACTLRGKLLKKFIDEITQLRQSKEYKKYIRIM
jgi:hypothetical protein